MYVLRDYQKKAVSIALKRFANYRGPFIEVLPTGSGKSLVIANIAKQLEEPVLILQPTKEILEQNYKKLLSYGIEDIGVYSASLKRKDIGNFTYATIGSIYKIPEKFKHFKYVIIDECHLVNPKNIDGMYNKFFKEIGNPRILGLTATPYRLVQRYLREGGDLVYTSTLSMINRIAPFFFKSIAYKISNKELFDRKYLCPLVYKFHGKDFVEKEIPVNTTGGDFDSDKMEKYVTKEDRIIRLCNVLNTYWNRKHILVFCTSILHANKTKATLKQLYGYDCDIITGKMSNKDREAVLERFTTGRVKAVLNVGVLTTGFDFPALDTVILARPTISLALYYQCIGRGIRLDPENSNKECYVVDLTNNVKRMGRVETIRIEKEEDGFRDLVVTEAGELSGKPLFSFVVKSDEKKDKIEQTPKPKDSTAYFKYQISFGKHHGKLLIDMKSKDEIGYIKWFIKVCENKNSVTYKAFVWWAHKYSSVKKAKSA